MISHKIGRTYNALARNAIKEKSYNEAKKSLKNALIKLNEAFRLNPTKNIRQKILLQIYFNSTLNYEIKK